MEKLYKRTATGAVQIWWQEINGDSWRTHSGQEYGAIVVSGWHKCEPKNEGKKNATTAHEQAIAEVESNYTKRLRLGYFKNVEDIDNPILFKPMLASPYEKVMGKLKFTNQIYSQPKLDGIRCVATEAGLFTRNGKEILSAPHVHEELLKLKIFNKFDVIDGELYNHQLRDNFDEIISLARKLKPSPQDLIDSKENIQFHVYDAITSTDNGAVFSTRFASLLKFFHLNWDDAPQPPLEGIIRIVPTDSSLQKQTDLDSVYESYLKEGYEGQIIRLNGPYENKRSKYLIKRKEFIDGEYTIVDIQEGVGNRNGMAGRVIFQWDNERTCGAGIKGSHDYARDLLANKKDFIGGDCTIKMFKQLTPDGMPRFPVCTAVYKGKRDL